MCHRVSQLPTVVDCFCCMPAKLFFLNLSTKPFLEFWQEGRLNLEISFTWSNKILVSISLKLPEQVTSFSRDDRIIGLTTSVS